MNNEHILDLFEIVQLAFHNAVKRPDLARWKSCAQCASVAAVRAHVDGDLFRAAALEGISQEAQRQAQKMGVAHENFA